MDSLQKRSFGIIMLLPALVAVAPGISIGAGMLLMFPAFQMIAGKSAPVFPRRLDCDISRGSRAGAPSKSFDLSAQSPHSSRFISGLSYKTAFKSELWTSIVPL
jgi:exopolysaccharide synthesis protein ExoD